MGSLLRLWKGLADVHNAPFKRSVKVPVEKFVALIENIVLLLDQTSRSESYNHRPIKLEILLEDRRKANPSILFC